MTSKIIFVAHSLAISSKKQSDHNIIRNVSYNRFVTHRYLKLEMWISYNSQNIIASIELVFINPRFRFCPSRRWDAVTNRNIAASEGCKLKTPLNKHRKPSRGKWQWQPKFWEGFSYHAPLPPWKLLKGRIPRVPRPVSAPTPVDQTLTVSEEMAGWCRLAD